MGKVWLRTMEACVYVLTARSRGGRHKDGMISRVDLSICVLHFFCPVSVMCSLCSNKEVPGGCASPGLLLEFFKVWMALFPERPKQRKSRKKHGHQWTQKRKRWGQKTLRVPSTGPGFKRRSWTCLQLWLDGAPATWGDYLASPPSTLIHRECGDRAQFRCGKS